MSVVCSALVLAFALVPCSPALASDLQYGQNPANGHWYGITFAPMSWTDGAAAAQGAGGYLASIGSAAEQTWIQGLLGPYQSWKYWIGLNDIASEGQYVWANGEPVLYTNWLPGQPDNGGGGEDAVEIQPGASWRWNDLNPATATSTKPLVEVDGLPRTGWTLASTVTVGSTPSYPATGDFNADGRTDLVVPNRASASASVLYGQAGGIPGATATFTVAAGPQSAAVGDFDGDGNLDWAVACYDGMRVAIRYGDGAGGFPAVVEVALNAKGQGLAAADFDADGLTDLAVTTVDSLDRLQIVRAGPARTFLAPALYATGSRPLHVTAGDLEGDGDVDLVVANEASDDLGVFRNLGDGTFASTALLARGDSPRHVALLDLDGDGLLDMAVPCAGQGLVRILYATSSGGFAAGPAVSGGSQPVWSEAVDTNGDGVLDLVTATNTQGAVTVQEILAGGSFAEVSVLIANSDLLAVVGLDLDGDGRPDLAATGSSTSRVVLFTKLSRDCNANGRDDDLDIGLGASTDCNGNLEPDECDLAQGGPFDCDANGLVDACEILADPALDLDADDVLDECEIAGTPYCFGDGTGAACPCDPGQAGDPGAGCRNSILNSGRLAAVGNPSVSNDSVSLRASGLLVTTTGLFFQGNSQQNAGLGSSFGDGLLCVNQSVVRLEIRSCQNAAMAFGRDVPGDPAVSADGLVPATGATRYYQVWYRDPPSYCTNATYNLTNGVRIVWAP